MSCAHAGFAKQICYVKHHSAAYRRSQALFRGSGRTIPDESAQQRPSAAVASQLGLVDADRVRRVVRVGRAEAVDAPVLAKRGGAVVKVLAEEGGEDGLSVAVRRAIV